ncbi:unnamed protein product [Adineta steineri]|uniref:Uncharacterized protein n=1 Tax=Adineta steineri TaxID=433720 RepID=A0A819RG67_9BILA|nr:unnamed protein product [Adineta steineri]
MGFFKEDGTVNDFFKNFEQGASTTVYAALAPELDVMYSGLAPHAMDMKVAERLWRLSEQMYEVTNGENQFHLQDVILSTTSAPSITTIVNDALTFNVQNRTPSFNVQHHAPSFNVQNGEPSLNVQQNREQLLKDPRYLGILNDLQNCS